MLIAIEGCVGAGKTTVAQGLAQTRAAELLLENFNAIPFLDEFHTNPVGCALETEFSFLLQHYHQLHLAQKRSGPIVCDFSMDKDLIFAELNILEDDVLRAFHELHRILSSRVPHPDVTIFLSASNELILKRIRSRGRQFELKAPPEYYTSLNDSYNRFFDQERCLASGKVIRIVADELDFCQDPTLFTQLSDMIDRVGRTVDTL